MTFLQLKDGPASGKPSHPEAQYGHGRCLMCGGQNPWSLGLRFTAGDRDTVCARFQAHPGLQGYDGILHGGIISALLDAAMTHCLFHLGVQAITGELNVRFLKPISCRALLDMRAWVVYARPPLYRVAAEIVHESCVMARAEAKFMRSTEPR